MPRQRESFPFVLNKMFLEVPAIMGMKLELNGRMAVWLAALYDYGVLGDPADAAIVPW